MAGPRIDFGLDAPGLCRGFAIGGTVALVVAVSAACLLPVSPWRLGVIIVSAIALCYFYGMACLMFFWSKVQKLRDRDHLLDCVGWTGHEQVLDVGCGRGLMLIGAAGRLTDGAAIGIDIWSTVDQAGNTPDATQANLVLAGVSDRASVATADMRSLPFADARFDVVVSHWAVHNVSDPADRQRSLAEMVRVLAPNGTIVLADIANRSDYAATLCALGLTHQQVFAPAWRDALLGAVSFGSFRPGALIARRG